MSNSTAHDKSRWLGILLVVVAAVVILPGIVYSKNSSAETKSTEQQLAIAPHSEVPPQRPVKAQGLASGSNSRLVVETKGLTGVSAMAVISDKNSASLSSPLNSSAGGDQPKEDEVSPQKTVKAPDLASSSNSRLVVETKGLTGTSDTTVFSEKNSGNKSLALNSPAVGDQPKEQSPTTSPNTTILDGAIMVLLNLGFIFMGSLVVCYYYFKTLSSRLEKCESKYTDMDRGLLKAKEDDFVFRNLNKRVSLFASQLNSLQATRTGQLNGETPETMLKQLALLEKKTDQSNHTIEELRFKISKQEGALSQNEEKTKLQQTEFNQRIAKTTSDLQEKFGEFDQEIAKTTSDLQEKFAEFAQEISKTADSQEKLSARMKTTKLDLENLEVIVRSLNEKIKKIEEHTCRLDIWLYKREVERVEGPFSAIAGWRDDLLGKLGVSFIVYQALNSVGNMALLGTRLRQVAGERLRKLKTHPSLITVAPIWEFIEQANGFELRISQIKDQIKSGADVEILEKINLLEQELGKFREFPEFPGLDQPGQETVIDIRNDLIRESMRDYGAEDSKNNSQKREEVLRFLDFLGMDVIDPAPGSKLDEGRHEPVDRTSNPMLPDSTVAKVVIPGVFDREGKNTAKAKVVVNRRE
ncbi:MAG: hypothetical protein WA705_18555 [Candidatus Ozemobacteraceae bacterium]